jgi:putative copper export protein
MQALFGITHGLDYLFSHLLAGQIVFFFGVLSAGGEPAYSLVPKYLEGLRRVAFLTFASSLTWMVLSSANMADSWALADLWQAMTATSFGHFWCVRVGALFLLAVFWPHILRARALLIIPPLAVLFISSMTGHAAAGQGSIFWPVVVDFGHSVAVAVWSGGLWGLYACSSEVRDS